MLDYIFYKHMVEMLIEERDYTDSKQTALISEFNKAINALTMLKRMH